MFNIFMVIFCFTIAFACFDADLFASYLISIAAFGLFQALYMANAGGAWDNAKKVVEVDLKEKGTPLHDAAVVGDGRDGGCRSPLPVARPRRQLFPDRSDFRMAVVLPHAHQFAEINCRSNGNCNKNPQNCSQF